LGILRSISGLDQLFINLKEHKVYLEDITADSEHSYEYLLYYHETMNIIKVIELVAKAVRMRPESLGTHFVI
jgi:aspartate oxidase